MSRTFFQKQREVMKIHFQWGVNAIPDGVKQFSQGVLKQYFYRSRGVKTENFRGPQQGGDIKCNSPLQLKIADLYSLYNSTLAVIYTIILFILIILNVQQICIVFI